MGSAIGHRIKYNGVGALRGKTRPAHTQQKFSQVPPPPPTGIQRTPSGPSQVSAFHRGLLKIEQCLLTINIQRLLCTVIKFHVVEEAKEAVLYFAQDFWVNFDRG